MQAIVKYRAEAASSDKLTYYTQIFAQQMSAEQKIEASSATGVADRMAEIQLGVALRQMKDAYERPEVSYNEFQVCTGLTRSERPHQRQRHL